MVEQLKSAEQPKTSFFDRLSSKAQVLESKLRDVFPAREVPARDTTPWRVVNVSVDGSELKARIRDKLDNEFLVAVPTKSLKLLQYVGDVRGKDKDMTLYAEQRRAPAGTPFGPPNRILYLGRYNDRNFEELKRVLARNDVPLAWYPIARKERPSEILPDRDLIRR